MKMKQILLGATICAVMAMPVASAITLDKPDIYETITFDHFENKEAWIQVSLKDQCYFTENSKVTITDEDGSEWSATLVFEKKNAYGEWQNAYIIADDITHGKIYSFEITNVVLSNSGKKQTIEGSFKSTTGEKTQYFFDGQNVRYQQTDRFRAQLRTNASTRIVR